MFEEKTRNINVKIREDLYYELKMFTLRNRFNTKEAIELILSDFFKNNGKI